MQSAAHGTTRARPVLRALPHLLTLVICLSASASWACSTTNPRTQVTLWAELGTSRYRLPQEVTLHGGDLMSIQLPRGTRVRVVDTHGQPSDHVQMLDAERFQRLSQDNGGTVPAEVRFGLLPSRLEWRHFGARAPGVAYLRLAASKEQGLVRVSVVERPAATRGVEHRWSDARRSEPIALTPFDTLRIELPGEPGDGWQVDVSDGTAALTDISQVQPTVDAAAPRVLLHIKTVLLRDGASVGTLTVQRKEREAHRFTVHLRPVPAC